MANLKENIIVFTDEDANYCVIVGTDDRGEAEKALREQEEEWYGKDHEEKPIPMEDFYSADIFYGEKNGEDYYYWGHEPKKHFDGGKVEILEGFVANLD
ncbi:MAG: hypothetical protein U1E54_01305 [Candidatus Levybacteria bacterium]|nr:hypothetical protein [Candidatus Levybacteria bacterium]